MDPEDGETDPVAVRAMMQRHRAALTAMHKETSALRGFVKTLEGTNEGLRHEVSALKLELQHYKDTEVRLMNTIETGELAAERLTGTIHRLNQDHAATVHDLESQRRQFEIEHKARIDRLTAQLEATQNPKTTYQPLPWTRLEEQTDHPVHILREVVVEDQKREERILQRNLAIVAGDNSVGGADALAKLLSFVDGNASSDFSMWIVVLRRIHTVLKERRALLGVPGVDSASDFFVRSRNSMIVEWVQLHKDIQRCCKVITSLKQNMVTTERLGTGPSTAQQYSNTLFYERQLELVSTVLNDVDTLCHRVKHHCFSDVDRLFTT